MFEDRVEDHQQLAHVQATNATFSWPHRPPASARRENPFIVGLKRLAATPAMCKDCPSPG